MAVPGEGEEMSVVISPMKPTYGGKDGSTSVSERSEGLESRPVMVEIDDVQTECESECECSLDSPFEVDSDWSGSDLDYSASTTEECIRNKSKEGEKRW